MLRDPHAHTSSSVSLRPRKKHAGWVTITLQTVSAFFDFTLPDAAHALGLSPTSMKNVCRRLGIPRWPYSRRGIFRAAPAPTHGASSSRSSRSSTSASLAPEDFLALPDPGAEDHADLWFLAAGHHSDEGTDFSFLLA